VRVAQPASAAAYGAARTFLMANGAGRSLTVAVLGALSACSLSPR